MASKCDALAAQEAESSKATNEAQNEAYKAVMTAYADCIRSGKQCTAPAIPGIVKAENQALFTDTATNIHLAPGG